MRFTLIKAYAESAGRPLVGDHQADDSRFVNGHDSALEASAQAGGGMRALLGKHVACSPPCMHSNVTFGTVMRSSYGAITR